MKRMETIDDEFTDAATTWMEKQAKDGKPFFLYYNSTRMHVYTHLKPSRKVRQGWGWRRMEWSSTTATSVSC